MGELIFGFIMICIVCAIIAGGVLVLVGTIMFLAALFIFMAKLGFIFLILGCLGYLAARLINKG